jgi:hypothetical protein
MMGMIKKHSYTIALISLITSNQSYGGFLDRFLFPFLPKRAHVVEEARRNMPPELKACKSLDDTKVLLQQEERRLFNAIKYEFKASDEIWDDLSKNIETKKEHFRNVVLKTPHPQSDHSLSAIDPELFQCAVRALQNLGINKDAISIVYDKRLHDVKSDWSATIVYDENGDIPSKLSLVPNNQLPNVKFIIEEHKEVDPYHEATHIIEIHNIQDDLLQKTLESLPYYNIITRDMNSYQSVKKWLRMQEKIADLMPLIQFKNPNHVQLMYQRCMCDCNNKINAGEKIEWNQTEGSATHPSACAEILPWILKIHELMQKENANKAATAEK